MHPIKHFITITKHRHKVIAHCVKAGIPLQGLLHDLSKFSPTEFIPGAKYYQGSRSPNEAEREARGYSEAWMHHKGRNRHHFEYWTDYNPETKQLEAVEMPIKYVKEMFCDRVAASKTYNGENYKDSDPYNYFLKGKNRRKIHPATSELLEKLLYMLKTEGEEKTFEYIRSLKDSNKKEIETGGSKQNLFTLMIVMIIVLSSGIGVCSAANSIKNHAKNDEEYVETADTPDIERTPDVPVVIETVDEPVVTKEMLEPETPDYVIHEYKKLPEKYEIKVKHITQQDKLLTGCELISAKTVLEYWGKKNISLDKMISHIDQSKIYVSSDGEWYGLSPSQAFIGDPYRLDGFGCYPPVIKNMVNDFKFKDIVVEDTSTMTLQELCDEYVVQDIPPLIWATECMIDPIDGDRWKLIGERGVITNETFVWPLNEHCLVLVGYDKKNYYLCDPLDYREVVKYDRELVEKRYNQLGQMSLIIRLKRNAN